MPLRLGQYVSGRGRKGRPLGLRGVRALVALTMAAFAGPPTASFASPQDSPTIEFSLTRVLASESLVITSAALSPDGRWIVLTEGDEQERSNLWVLSTEGGPPIPLTEGPYIDTSPVWFPSSDRIAFISTRPPIYTIMTVPFDPHTGRATGPPRQVSLDVVGDNFDVSPDGRWISHFEGSALKVIPATGGTARTIADATGALPVWSSDSRSIHYLMGGGRSPKRRLMRVSVDGGRPETVFTWPTWMVLIRGGANRAFVVRDPLQGPGVEMATLEGLALGRLDPPRGMGIVGISSEGDQILAMKRELVAPLTVLPVAGGPARLLTEGRTSGTPLGWSADGEKVLVELTLDDEAVLFLAPVDGGPMRQIKLPKAPWRGFDPVLSGDGNHVLYAVDEGDDGLSTLEVSSIEDDWSWELSRHHTPIRGRGRQGFLSGAGGSFYRDGEDFLYIERHEGRYELHKAPPRGPSRLLRTFGDREPEDIAVHGDRIASIENSEEEASLFLASPGEAPARRLLRLNGMLDMAVWSPNGTRIAAYHFDPTLTSGNAWKPEGRDLIVLDVSPSGEMVGDLRRYTVPGGHWWSPRWLPDGRGILVVGIDANIWLIPLDPEARPVNLTQDDPHSAYSYRLSPDGRSIVYPSYRQRGSSIWLLKLEEPLR